MGWCPTFPVPSEKWFHDAWRRLWERNSQEAAEGGRSAVSRSGDPPWLLPPSPSCGQAPSVPRGRWACSALSTQNPTTSCHCIQTVPEIRDRPQTESSKPEKCPYKTETWTFPPRRPRKPGFSVKRDLMNDPPWTGGDYPRENRKTKVPENAERVQNEHG